MIAFKDFAPQPLKPGGLLSLPVYELFDGAVQAANAWIAAEGVPVLNVETVLLPNLWRSGGTGTGASLVRAQGGDFPVDWFQFVRVWYHAE